MAVLNVNDLYHESLDSLVRAEFSKARDRAELAARLDFRASENPTPEGVASMSVRIASDLLEGDYSKAADSFYSLEQAPLSVKGKEELEFWRSEIYNSSALQLYPFRPSPIQVRPIPVDASTAVSAYRTFRLIEYANKYHDDLKGRKGGKGPQFKNSFPITNRTRDSVAQFITQNLVNRWNNARIAQIGKSDSYEKFEGSPTLHSLRYVVSEFLKDGRFYSQLVEGFMAQLHHAHDGVLREEYVDDDIGKVARAASLLATIPSNRNSSISKFVSALSYAVERYAPLLVDGNSWQSVNEFRISSRPHNHGFQDIGNVALEIKSERPNVRDMVPLGGIDWEMVGGVSILAGLAATSIYGTVAYFANLPPF